MTESLESGAEAACVNQASKELKRLLAPCYLAGPNYRSMDSSFA